MPAGPGAPCIPFALPQTFELEQVGMFRRVGEEREGVGQELFVERMVGVWSRSVRKGGRKEQRSEGGIALLYRRIGIDETPVGRSRMSYKGKVPYPL